MNYEAVYRTAQATPVLLITQDRLYKQNVLSPVHYESTQLLICIYFLKVYISKYFFLLLFNALWFDKHFFITIHEQCETVVLSPVLTYWTYLFLPATSAGIYRQCSQVIYHLLWRWNPGSVYTLS